MSCSLLPTPPLHHDGPTGAQVLQDGIGRSPEQEEPIDPAVGRRCLEDPQQLLALELPLLQGLAR